MSELNNNQHPKYQKLETLPLIIFILFICLIIEILLFESMLPPITDLILISIITITCLIEGLNKKKVYFVASGILSTVLLLLLIWTRYFI